MSPTSKLKLKLLTLVPALLTWTVVCSAQGVQEWTTLTSSSKDFEITLPGDFLVDRGETFIEVIAFGPLASLRIETESVSHPKSRVTESSFIIEGRMSKEKIAIGGFVGWRMEYESNDVFTTRVHIASSTAYYLITASSDAKDNPTVVRFLNSIRCAGKHLTTPAASAVYTTSTKTFDQLAASAEVIAALERTSDATAIGKYGKVKEKTTNSFIGYSRGLILLRKPRPGYTEEARWRGKQGTIKANIEFRKDGQIGLIIVDPSFDKGLATNVGRAAARIKFIPAEQNGRPVDIMKVIEYTFSIY